MMTTIGADAHAAATDAGLAARRMTGAADDPRALESEQVSVTASLTSVDQDTDLVLLPAGPEDGHAADAAAAENTTGTAYTGIPIVLCAHLVWCAYVISLNL